MKNRGASVLLLLTVASLMFMAGFFLGRGYNRSVPQIQAAPALGLPDPGEPGPSAETAEAQPLTTPAVDGPEAADGRIDINTASVQQLSQLPGIGPTLAQRIVDYRTAHGPFSSVSELKNVYGIGDKKIAALLDCATVGG